MNSQAVSRGARASDAWPMELGLAIAFALAVSFTSEFVVLRMRSQR
jgi:hypothetical protein